MLEMKKGQLLEEGILIKQSNTIVAQIKALNPRLEAAIKAGAGLPLKEGWVACMCSTTPLVQSIRGMGFTVAG